jgi:acetyltransferase-like isoleucine patch superfamily enzyme
MLKSQGDLHVYGRIFMKNTNLRLGKNVSLYPDMMMFGNGSIEIGANTVIGNGTIIYANADKNGGVKIGNDVMIAAHCYIIDSDHGMGVNEVMRKQPMVTAPVSIGNNVWIGAGCQILKGTIINDGAVIGAGSVVTKHIPTNSIAVGVPVRVIGQRKNL